MRLGFRERDEMGEERRMWIRDKKKGKCKNCHQNEMKKEKKNKER